MPNLINKFIEGGTAGTNHTAGLPNIKGTLPYYYGRNNNVPSGAFNSSYFDSSYNVGPQSSGTIFTPLYPKFDASQSNSIYGNSTTVQPASLEMTYCIKY